MAIKLSDCVNDSFANMLSTFYINNVILPHEKIEELKKLKDLNIKRLRDGLEEYNMENKTEYKIEEIIVQGSIAMGTAVSADEKNYDIDVAIVMNKNELPEGTLSAKRVISESLKKKCFNMKNDPDPTGNSITVEYEEGYHLDFALYGRDNNKIYHCGTNSWEERNPKAISLWFNVNNQNSNDMLRKIVKYLKYFCKQNSDWIMPGGLIISVLVAETIIDENLSAKIDVILKNIINKIINRLEHNTNIYNPTDSSKSLIKKQKDIDKLNNFKNRLKVKSSKINELSTKSDNKDIYEAWNYFFGGEYFSDNFNFKTNKIEDTEEFVENYFDVTNMEVTENLISCQLSSIEGKTNGRTFRNYKSDEPLSVSKFKDEQLIFTANIQKPSCYKVLWKVKNNGPVAEKNNSLRGNINYSNTLDNFNYVDVNGNKRYENISFSGHHYVECYILKENNIIKKERFFVNLVD